MNINRKIKRVLDQIADFWEEHDNEDTIRNGIVPFFLSYFEQLDNITEREQKALCIIKDYWLNNIDNVKELKDEGRKLSQEENDSKKDRAEKSRLFGLAILAVPYSELDDNTDGNFLGYFRDSLIGAGMPPEYLFECLLSDFKDVIDRQLIETPLYTDLKNKYYMTDYGSYNKSLKMRYGRLLYRSPKNEERDYNIDIIITLPSVIMLPTVISGLVIELVDEMEEATTIESLVQEYGLNKHVNIYRLKTNSREYYFDASCVRVYHNKLKEHESSVDRYINGGGDEHVRLNIF